MAHITSTGFAVEPPDDPERFDIDSAFEEMFSLKSSVNYALDMAGNLVHPNDIPVTGYAQRIKEVKDECTRPAHHAALEPLAIETHLDKGSAMRDRFTGCVLGGAVGDALGASVEFMTLSEIRTQFGNQGIRDFAPAYGRLGAITDDTQMTLFTAEGMIRSFVQGKVGGNLSIETITAHAYHRWLMSQGGSSLFADFTVSRPGWLYWFKPIHSRRAPGNTCLSGLREARTADAVAANDSKGCGAVMRMAPVGLAGWRFDWNATYVMQLGANLGHLTHGHPSGYLPAGAFAVIICSILKGAPLCEAVQISLEQLSQHAGHEETTKAIELACALSKSGNSTDKALAQLGQGWTGDEALAIGLYCALKSNSLEEGVILAANIDGDSDSTGSIAGNLLGAMYGEASIPSRWLDQLEMGDVIEEISGDLFDCIEWLLGGVKSNKAIESASHYCAKYPPE
jgi:ADP-ribosyl-[dinitrogen reductase] hydrolase